MVRLVFISLGIGLLYWGLVSCRAFIVPASTSVGGDTIVSNPQGEGRRFRIEFSPGVAHNHPTFAFWLEDMDGNYIETLFVTRYIGTGVFGYAPRADGGWDAESGPARRPAALPYWSHRRGVKAQDGLLVPDATTAVPDAYTGATPAADFTLNACGDKPLPKRFRLLMEINQTWDWNAHWTNGKYPGNADYMTSAQPSLVYAVAIETQGGESEWFLNPIGHGSYDGSNGRLYTDLSTLTTALQIVGTVRVTLR